MCKNGGCGCAYESAASNLAVCVYHPGVPIFHEGLKYWSCCTKRTSDFSAFLAQKGCQSGNHKWLKSVRTDTKQIHYLQNNSYRQKNSRAKRQNRSNAATIGIKRPIPLYWLSTQKCTTTQKAS